MLVTIDIPEDVLNDIYDQYGSTEYIYQFIRYREYMNTPDNVCCKGDKCFKDHDSDRCMTSFIKENNAYDFLQYLVDNNYCFDSDGVKCVIDKCMYNAIDLFKQCDGSGQTYMIREGMITDINEMVPFMRLYTKQQVIKLKISDILTICDTKSLVKMCGVYDQSIIDELLLRSSDLTKLCPKVKELLLLDRKLWHVSEYCNAETLISICYKTEVQSERDLLVKELLKRDVSTETLVDMCKRFTSELIIKELIERNIDTETLLDMCKRFASALVVKELIERNIDIDRRKWIAIQMSQKGMNYSVIKDLLR